MDWESKTSAFDFAELGGEEDDARLAAVVGTSSSLGVHKNGGGFSVDLRLGGLGDYGDGSKLKEPRGSAIVSSSPSGSSKRARGAANGTQNVSCLVDGCTADLSNCREYHRRHRVCERHSKTPVVFVGGKEQRFCQQCSRFQSLGEFDEEKRSCRKRLDGHNRRRRKPQPESFYMSSGSFLSNHQGARLLQFSGAQSYTTSTECVVPTWPMVAKQHQDLHVTDQHSTSPNSLPSMYNWEDKRFPFLLANHPERSNQPDPEVSICQRLFNDHGPGERFQGHQKISSDHDRLTQPVDSRRALSLLSMHPTQTSGTSSSRLVAGNVINFNQPRGTSLHSDGLVQYSCSQGLEVRPSVLVPQTRSTNSLCNEMLQVAPDDLLEKGASQVLPFSWK